MTNLEKHLDAGLDSFLNEPAASDFQRGYLRALINIWYECGDKNKGLDERYQVLRAQTLTRFKKN